MHIYMIRHGESVWNARGVWQGQADPELSETGIEQARHVSERLAEVAFDRVIASDLTRAVQTAEFISAGHDLEVEQRPGFRECDVGGWAGHTSSEIAERFPDQWQAYQAGQDPRRGGGESLTEMQTRVEAAFHELVDSAEAHGWETLCLVSHGGVVRELALLALDLHESVGHRRPLAAPTNTAVSEMTVGTRGRRLLRYNDDGHLSAVGDTALDA